MGVLEAAGRVDAADAVALERVEVSGAGAAGFAEEESVDVVVVGVDVEGAAGVGDVPAAVVGVVVVGLAGTAFTGSGCDIGVS
jgi:hypothetical protein